MIKIHNTLSNKVEDFKPISKDSIGIYVCGPTVYDYAHIGNARSATVFDAMQRTIRHAYPNYKVTYVRNITDVDDKIINKSHKTGLTIKEVTRKYSRQYSEDMGYIGNLSPDIEPKAMDHIEEMQQIIATLINNGHAYSVDGNVLFSTKSFQGYGSLSNKTNLKSGARVEVEDYKRDPNDFLLWKNTKDDMGWDSPWGFGRPGWHIECSAMSHKYLGTNFDLHCGGQDLIFPHHENEIAQSCCAFSDCYMAKYWMHNGYVTVNNQKMSKTLKNFTTIYDLKKQFSGGAIRLMLLTAQYMQPLDFTKDKILSSQKVIDKWMGAIVDERHCKGAKSSGNLDLFIEALYNNLNTPLAISYMHSMYKNNEYNALMQAMDILGFNDAKNLNIITKDTIDKDYVENLLKERQLARSQGDYTKADLIKNTLTKMNIEIKDSNEGSTWRLKP